MEYYRDEGGCGWFGRVRGKVERGEREERLRKLDSGVNKQIVTCTVPAQEKRDSEQTNVEPASPIDLANQNA